MVGTSLLVICEMMKLMAAEVLAMRAGDTVTGAGGCARSLDATNFGLSRLGSCTNLVSGVSNFRAPLVNLDVMPDEAYFSMLILKCPLVVGGGSGWGGCWVGRGGERRREEEKESDGSSGSGMALLVEEEPTAPEVTWGLRDGAGREIE